MLQVIVLERASSLNMRAGTAILYAWVKSRSRLVGVKMYSTKGAPVERLFEVSSLYF